MKVQQDKQKWQREALHSPRLTLYPEADSSHIFLICCPTFTGCILAQFLHLFQHSNFCCFSLLCWFCTTLPHFWIDALDNYSVVIPGLLKPHTDNNPPFSWEFNDNEYFASIRDTSTFTALSSPEPVAVILIRRMESSQPSSPLAHKYKRHHYNQKNIRMQHKVICKLEKQGSWSFASSKNELKA